VDNRKSRDYLLKKLFRVNGSILEVETGSMQVIFIFLGNYIFPP
jgi:hypothetical protein